MSKRVTTKTAVKDKDLAKRGLTLAKINFREEGNNLRIIDGKFRGVTVNTSTGEIVSDSDYGLKDADFNQIRQAYSEAICHKRAQVDGIQIDERTVERNGDIVLLCHMA